MDEEQQKLLTKRFESFLNLNYACTCPDKDCPGNYFEALLMTEIVVEELLKKN